jgi:basic membrane protein A
VSKLKTIAALAAALLVPAWAAGTAAAAPEAGAKTQVKVAFIITDPLAGSAWTQSWDTARKELEAALHVPTTTVGPAPENNQVATQATDLINQGYNVIVAEDFAYQPFLHKVAQQHPDTRFILIGPNIEQHLDNVATVYANLWQVRYAEGVLAGLMTKSNKLGFVTAHTIPSVVAGINGFQLGAHAANPKATTIVVETGQWYDPAGGTRAAVTLAARGADVIAQHEDDTGSLLGAQQAHVWAMGSEADTHTVAPKTYLSGSVYHWGDYLIKQVREIMAGNWKATDYSGDLASGLVQLGPINSAVPADVKAKVEAAVAGIKDGSIKVFKGPVKYNTGKVMVPAGQTLTGPGEIYPKQTGFVEGVVGKIKG